MMIQMPKIFVDDDYQKRFEQEGYAIIPLLDEDEINRLTSIFKTYHPNVEKNSFGSSTFLNSKEEKLALSNAIQEILFPKFNTFLTNFEALGSTFLFKTKGNNSELAAHQDWTIVDESINVAANIWIPLIDTSPENGTLSVLPKSHSKFIFTLRAPTIPQFFEGYEKLVFNYLKPLNIKAGTAVILNESLVHYSASNTKDDIRIAITSGIINKDAEMIFHFMDKKNKIERFEVPRDFLLSFNEFHKNIYEYPKNLKSLGMINFDFPEFNETTLNIFFSSQQIINKKSGWIKKIKHFLKA